MSMNTHDRYALAIPTINRADLLNPALKAMETSFPTTEIFVLDNGNQNIYQDEVNRIRIIRPQRNLGVAGSWNQLLYEAFRKGIKTVFVLNDDILWGKSEGAVSLWVNSQTNGFVQSRIGWCNFFITKEVFELVGDFDEGFYPAYFEDNDYGYRLRLNGIESIKDKFLTPAIFRNSSSIAKDPTLNNNFSANRARYINKWGGEPRKEKYKKPFNGKQ